MDENTVFNDPVLGQIKMVPFPGPVAAAVDALVLVAKYAGSKDQVESEHDWVTVKQCYKLYQSFWPRHASRFERDMKLWRSAENKHGIGGTEKGVTVQHQLEIPRPFFAIFNTIFPKQKWDRKFVFRLARELPQLKAIDANDKF